MPTDDLNIESHLAYSEKLRGLAAGHQQETKQLLENIEELQVDVRQLLQEKKSLLAANAEKDAKIQELEQRIADLQRNASYTVNGDYIEALHVDKLMAVNKPKRAKLKNKFIDYTNQLDLWTSNPAISM